MCGGGGIGTWEQWEREVLRRQEKIRKEAGYPKEWEKRENMSQHFAIEKVHRAVTEAGTATEMGGNYECMVHVWEVGSSDPPCPHTPIGKTLGRVCHATLPYTDVTVLERDE